ncbi:MAG: hypothetical protein IJD81_04735 [Oscillospiraceae bacterium]|nr:hypothetical protein [Oscillospiraceae bacterium]
MKHKLFPILLALVLLLTGCSAAETEPAPPAAQEFAKAGIHLTLTEEFYEKEHMGYTTCYLSDDIAVFLLKEEYTLFENTDFSSASTPEEYAGLVWNANQFTGNVPLVTEGNLKYFEYSYSANGNDYTYRTYVFKAADAFWLVQFASLSDSYDSLKGTMQAYAETVVFDAPYTQAQ